MAFFFEKSLLCRYSALSLHPETGTRGGLFWVRFGFVLGSFWVRSGFVLGSLCLRSGFAPKSGGKEKPKRDEIDLDVV